MAIKRLTAKSSSSNCRVLCERRLDDTPDKSEFAQFNWYQYVLFIDPVGGTFDKKLLARFVVVATNVSKAITFWCLPATAQIVVRISVTLLTADKLNDHDIKAQMLDLD